MERYIPKVILIGYILVGKWKEDDWGIQCEGCIRMEVNNLGWYIRNSIEPLIEGVKAVETIHYNNWVNKKELKQRWMRRKKGVRKNKRIHGQFARESPETTVDKETRNCLRKADLKLEKEGRLKKLNRDLDFKHVLLEKKKLRRNIKIGWKEHTIFEEIDSIL